jgi:hypothetical protein
MKVKNLLLSSGFIVAAAAAFVWVDSSNTRATFTPRNIQEEGYNESVDILKKLRGSLATGNFEVSDVIEMTAAVNDVDRLQGNRDLNMSWWEMGPDNIGGRTRAILAYTDEIIFAGSVTGGLYKSTNGGNNWSRVESLDSFGRVMSISTIDATEDGTIYIGTGSQFESGFDGSGASGSIGCGMYRSLDQGATWEIVPGTDPAEFTSGSNLAYINDVSADANIPGRIWLAGADGVGYWEPGMSAPNMSVSGIPNTGGHDIEWSADGTVCYIGVSNGRVYRSLDGGASFSQVGSSAGMSNKQRTRIAISRDDSNVAYVLYAQGGIMGGMYYTSDKGETWSVKWPTGIDNVYPLFGDNGQAYYDLALAIKPGNPGICWVGGVSLWKAGANTQPEQIAANFDFGSSQYYVHSDIQTFEVASNGDWYIGCDGGLFKSVDGGNSFTAINRGYNVTQFYGIAHGGGYPAMGGAQDNGTILIPGMDNANFNTITWQQGVSVGGGDGFDCEISNVTVPGVNVAFSSVYFGAISRFNAQGSGGSFYDDEVIAAIGTDGEAGSFYTTLRLFENTNDVNSQQYVWLVNNRNVDLYSSVNGTDTTWLDTTLYTQNMTLPFPYRFPVGDTLHFWSVLNRPAVYSTTPLTVDPNYSWLAPQALTSTIDSTICDTTIVGYHQEIDQITQQTVTIYWSDTIINPITGAPIIVNDSSLVVVGVDTTYMTVPDLSIQCTTTTWYYYAPDQLQNVRERWQVQDKFTSIFVTGFFGTEGMWMTRQALNFNTSPDWWKIGNAPGSGVKAYEFSKDGNTLFYSSWSGTLYRVTGFNQVWSVDDIPNLTTSTIITNAGGTITSIACDPNNADHLIITVGGYGSVSSGKVRECFNANAATPTFSNIWYNTSPLNKMPIFSSVIDVNDPSGNTIVIGTEYGVWATNDGGATWTHSSGVATSIPSEPAAGASVGSLAYVPVFDLRQQQVGQRPYMNPQNYGVIYAGTHGRGIFRSDDFFSVDVAENNAAGQDGNDVSLSVYPNPTTSTAFVNLNVTSTVGQAYIQVYNVNGQLVKSVNVGQLTPGSHKIDLEVESLSNGTYVVKTFAGNASGTAKFIKQ